MVPVGATASPLPDVVRGGLWDSLAFIRDPGAFTAGAGRELGDFYRLRLPGADLHVVTHPGLIEEILVSGSDDFEKSRIYWGQLRRIIGDALGSLEGDRWRVLRKLEQPFFSPRFADEALPEARRSTHAEFDDLEARITSPGVATLSALEIFSQLNTRLLLSVLFGVHAVGERREITRRIVDGENTIAWRSKFPWRSVTGWFNGRNLRAARHRAYFQAFADAVERRDDPDDRPRLVAALRRFRSDPRAPRYGDELLRNEMIVNLGAGSETHGTAEAWCLYLLFRHPHVLETLRAEVDRVSGGRPLTEDHVQELPFTLRVLRETLRLYPTAYGVVRDCTRATTLGNGYEAVPRQVFFISLVGLHRSPRFWDAPDDFRPERFEPARHAEIPRYQYLPFGAGRHICIGQHLVLPTMALAVSEFARRFDWTFHDRDVGMVGRATLKPRSDFLVEVRLRGRS